MFCVLFFLHALLAGLDFSRPDLGIGYPDNYSQFFVKRKTVVSRIPQRKTGSSAIFLMEDYGEIYRNICKETSNIGFIRNMKKLENYNEEVFNIPDGFQEYSVQFINRPTKDYDIQAGYAAFIDHAYARLLRLQALLCDAKKKESITITIKEQYYGSDQPFLDKLIEHVTWQLGTWTQLKLMHSNVLYKLVLCQHYCLLKNKRDLCEVVCVDGRDYPKTVSNNKKRDILYSFSNKERPDLVYFQNGSTIIIINPFVFSMDMSIYKEAEFKQISLPSENSWFSVSRFGSVLLSVDKSLNTLLLMQDWTSGNPQWEELLTIEKSIIKHGIFINRNKVMLVIKNKNRVYNVLFDIPTRNCWILNNANPIYQRFLIAGEAEIPDYFIIGGFSADMIRHKACASLSDSLENQFVYINQAFSTRMFKLDEAKLIPYDS